MRTTTIALGLMALAALGAAKAKKEASLHDFFAGDWDIFVYKTPFATAEMPEDMESTHYTFTARNGTDSILDGIVLTEEGKEPVKMFVEGARSPKYTPERTAQSPTMEQCAERGV